MRVLFTICGRAGSKGFKNKNVKELRGVPLINYTLAAIKLSKGRNPEIDINVALNTDSIDLINQANVQNIIDDIIVVSRDEALAGDKVAKIKVIQDTLEKVTAQTNVSYDYIIDLDLTSPLRTCSDIENALNTMSSGKYDIVFSVVPARRNPYFNMVEKKGDYYKKVCDSNFTTRQESPKIYELNASIYVYRSNFLENTIEKTILDYNCGISIMDDYLVLDIDSEEDYEMLEVLLPIYLDKSPELKEMYLCASECEVIDEGC